MWGGEAGGSRIFVANEASPKSRSYKGNVELVKLRSAYEKRRMEMGMVGRWGQGGYSVWTRKNRGCVITIISNSGDGLTISSFFSSPSPPPRVYFYFSFLFFSGCSRRVLHKGQPTLLTSRLGVKMRTKVR